MSTSARAQRARLAAADPVMAALIERLGELDLGTRRRRLPDLDAYGALLRSVVGQQLSVRAAATIHARLLELFDGSTPSPRRLLELDPQRLRDVGLSWRKVDYVRDLAEHVLSGELELDRLAQLDDGQVIAEITAVRGFGVWSAQMFLIFFLERPDVLPTADLGIRRAAQREYELAELPQAEELERIAAPWRPLRSLACVYLWESLANEPI